MGCSESKLEEQRAVVLCRGRVELLAAAIRHREALGAAHATYSDSLLSVSAALHRILLLVPASSSSPVLPLPTRRKTEPSPPPPVVSSARCSHPSSHIKFASSESDFDNDDDDDDDEDSPSHSPGIPPAHHLQHYGTIPCVAGFGNIYYARSQPPPPSVSIEQRPPSHETVQVSSFDSYAATCPSYGYPYASFPGYYGSTGGLFGHSSAPQAMPSPMATTASALGGSSSSRALPPPPSPPKTSTWDFLNPFNTYNDYYYHYTPSRSSREVRDEEGIPDLEEIDQEEEKDAYGYQNGGTDSASDGSYHHHSRSVAADRRSKVEPEVIDNKDLTMAKEFKRTQVGQRNASEVAHTIKSQFQKASQCFAALSVLLEVDNCRYQSRHSPSDHGYEVMDSSGLASTLQKLYVWERKLHREVRAEEKMRLLLSKSHKELKHLLERGAEDDKIESTRNLIDKLSTKIRIAIRVVSSVSRKINLLRDEELWPRMTELVLGFVSMWNLMLECHRVQYWLMTEAKRVDLVIAGWNSSGDHADEIMQLEMEMLKWSCNFSAWINAQRNCVKALNGWLLLCLHREPGAASDASPRRMGAPPVFIICNSWSQAIDRTSEKAVLDAMQDFAAALHHLWGQKMVEQNERMAAIRARDRWLRAMKKKRREMHKEVDSLNKRLALVPARFRLPMAAGHHQVVFEGRHTAECSSSLQLGLEKIFEAVEDFSASSVKAYQELLEHLQTHHTH